MTPVKNLLFDLGGVIIDIERQRCVDALTALGMTNADDMIGLYRQSGPFLQLEAGALSPKEFCEAMRQSMPPGERRNNSHACTPENCLLQKKPSRRNMFLLLLHATC